MQSVIMIRKWSGIRVAMDIGAWSFLYTRSDVCWREGYLGFRKEVFEGIRDCGSGGGGGKCQYRGRKLKGRKRG